MIKTQTNEENKFMKRILPHYYRYVTEHPHTFLVRIYGMHRVKMYHLNRKVHFVIMGSVFDTPCQINTIYDLKGSLVGRSATPEERASGGVLKDNDLIADGVKLKLGSKRELFIMQLEKDATFLSQLNIMDYSLLVNCHTLHLIYFNRWEFIIALGGTLKKLKRFLLPRLRKADQFYHHMRTRTHPFDKRIQIIICYFPWKRGAQTL